MKQSSDSEPQMSKVWKETTAFTYSLFMEKSYSSYFINYKTKLYESLFWMISLVQ